MCSICDPIFRIVRMQCVRMFCQEFFGLWPEGRDSLWGVVQVDCETIGFITILHVPENVVVNVAEKMNVWLYSPIVLRVCQSFVFVEKTTVPTAHLMVGYHARILHFLFFQDFGGFLEEVIVNPRWHIPMLFRNQFCRN